MAWTTEDRSWLEQRLEQHQRDIQAQLERHFLKIAVENTAGRNGVESTRIISPPPRVPAKGNLATRIIPPAPEVPARQVDFVDKQRHEDGEDAPDAPEAPTNSSSVHFLVVDDIKHSIDPNSMRGMVAVFLNKFMSMFINVCVLINTITMFVELQWLGSIANDALGIEAHNGWPHAEIVWQVLEYSFTLIFLLDLVLQLYAFRLDYFRSQFNILDSVVIVITTLETFVLTPLAAGVGNVSVVRLLRLAKLARAFKAFRTFKSFEALRVLIAVFCFSFGSTFWSLVILIVFQIMASIFMCHSLHDFVMDSSQDPATRAWVNSMYGDGVKSFWTIFELTFSGCWPNYARRIIEEVNPVYSLFYFVYVYVVVFVATRIVAALFMKETLTQYSNDAEMMVRERAKKSEWVKKSLTDLFDEADTNGNGFLSLDELYALFDHPKVQLWMKELGVDAGDTDTLVQLLDEEGQIEVNRDDFVHGITRLKGEARSQDLVAVYNYVKRILVHVQELRYSVDGIMQEKGLVSRFDAAIRTTANHPDINNCPPPTSAAAKADCKAKYGGFIPPMWCSRDHCFTGKATVTPG